MGFIEEMFDPAFMFDNELKQRRDLESLRAQLPEAAAEIQGLRTQVQQLQLLTNALVALIEAKGVGTRDELEVLVQQVDLLDGREDGQIGETWAHAPRCENCQHFINPDRDACLYCGRGTAQRSEDGPYRGSSRVRADAPRLATCAKCTRRVPQQETLFNDDGELLCVPCHQA